MTIPLLLIPSLTALTIALVAAIGPLALGLLVVGAGAALIW